MLEDIKVTDNPPINIYKTPESNISINNKDIETTKEFLQTPSNEKILDLGLTGTMSRTSPYNLNDYVDLVGESGFYFNQDLKEIQAQNQTRWERVGNVLPRLAGGIIGKTINGLGLLPTMGARDTYMSEVGDGIDKWTKEMFPIYKTKEYDKASPLAKLGYTSYWTDDITDGVAFMGSALLPGMALSKLGTGLALAKVLGNTAKFAKLGSIVTGVEEGAELLKFARLSGKTIDLLKAGKNIDMLSTWAVSTAMESGVEANGVYHEVKERLKNEYKTEILANGKTLKRRYNYDEIESLARDAAHTTYKGNMAALAISNAVEVFTLFKGITGSRFMSEGAKSLTVGQKIGTVGKTALLNMASEGVYEENIQLAISDMAKKYANAGNRPSDISYEDMLKEVGKNWAKNFTTDEGQQNIIAGAIIGGIFGAGMGSRHTFKNRNAEIEETNNLKLNALAAKSNDFKINKFYQKDDKGIIVRDKQGKAKLDTQAIHQSFTEQLGDNTINSVKLNALNNNDLSAYEQASKIQLMREATPVLRKDWGEHYLIDSQVDLMVANDLEQINVLREAKGLDKLTALELKDNYIKDIRNIKNSITKTNNELLLLNINKEVDNYKDIRNINSKLGRFSEIIGNNMQVNIYQRQLIKDEILELEQRKLLLEANEDLKGNSEHQSAINAIDKDISLLNKDTETLNKAYSKYQNKTEVLKMLDGFIKEANDYEIIEDIKDNKDFDKRYNDAKSIDDLQELIYDIDDSNMSPSLKKEYKDKIKEDITTRKHKESKDVINEQTGRPVVDTSDDTSTSTILEGIKESANNISGFATKASNMIGKKVNKLFTSATKELKDSKYKDSLIEIQSKLDSIENITIDDLLKTKDEEQVTGVLDNILTSENPEVQSFINSKIKSLVNAKLESLLQDKFNYRGKLTHAVLNRSSFKNQDDLNDLRTLKSELEFVVDTIIESNNLSKDDANQLRTEIGINDINEIVDDISESIDEELEVEKEVNEDINTLNDEFKFSKVGDTNFSNPKENVLISSLRLINNLNKELTNHGLTPNVHNSLLYLAHIGKLEEGWKAVIMATKLVGVVKDNTTVFEDKYTKVITKEALDNFNFEYINPNAIINNKLDDAFINNKIRPAFIQEWLDSLNPNDKIRPDYLSTIALTNVLKLNLDSRLSDNNGKIGINDGKQLDIIINKVKEGSQVTIKVDDSKRTSNDTINTLPIGIYLDNELIGHYQTYPHISATVSYKYRDEVGRKGLSSWMNNADASELFKHIQEIRDIANDKVGSTAATELLDKLIDSVPADVKIDYPAARRHLAKVISFKKAGTISDIKLNLESWSNQVFTDLKANSEVRDNFVNNESNTINAEVSYKSNPSLIWSYITKETEQGEERVSLRTNVRNVTSRDITLVIPSIKKDAIDISSLYDVSTGEFINNKFALDNEDRQQKLHAVIEVADGVFSAIPMDMALLGEINNDFNKALIKSLKKDINILINDLRNAMTNRDSISQIALEFRAKYRNYITTTTNQFDIIPGKDSISIKFNNTIIDGVTKSTSIDVYKTTTNIKVNDGTNTIKAKLETSTSTSEFNDLLNDTLNGIKRNVPIDSKTGMLDIEIVNGSYTDKITNTKHNSYIDFLYNTDALQTNLGYIKDNKTGKVITNVNPRGNYPIVIEVSTKQSSQSIPSTNNTTRTRDEIKENLQSKAIPLNEYLSDKLDKEYYKTYSDLFSHVFAKDTKVVIVELSDEDTNIAFGEEAVGSNGLFENATNTVYIFKNYNNPGADSRLLAHEVLHKIVIEHIKTLNNDKRLELDNKLNSFKDSIRNAIDNNTHGLTENDINYLEAYLESSKDNDETIVYPFTNANIAIALNKIRTDINNESTSLWNSFKNMIKSILADLGFINKIDELVNILDSVFVDNNDNIDSIEHDFNSDPTFFSVIEDVVTNNIISNESLHSTSQSKINIINKELQSEYEKVCN